MNENKQNCPDPQAPGNKLDSGNQEIIKAMCL